MYNESLASRKHCRIPSPIQLFRGRYLNGLPPTVPKNRNPVGGSGYTAEREVIMNTRIDAVADILRKAFQVEVDGFTFYSMNAERANKPAVRKLYERLARDETEHQAYLRAVMRRYEDHGAQSFHIDRRDPDLGEFSSQIFTDSLKDQAHSDILEIGALSIGIQLESNAVEFFKTAARNTSDPQISGFYQFLADWEGMHLRILNQLFESLHEDVWPEEA